MSPYRPAFTEALNLLAQACAILRRQGVPPPILVGGAVVEFDTAGDIHTGDLDLVTASDDEVAAALLAVGFQRETGLRHGLHGYFHPSLPVAVELVSGGYFDGLADRSRIRIVEVPGGEVLMAPTEDLIADRAGQWFASGKRDAKMLRQAQILLALASALDEDYLERRLREETMNRIGLAELRTHHETDQP